jgi:predicted ATP-binding protein involved in virulence
MNGDLPIILLIDKDKGFTLWTHQNKILNLTDLSSGEQHEVILLYELIFKAEKNTLVLIDEPEISLHITWQKEFLNDLLRIIELQQIQVIMATHSPQIIHNRWDLAYNLETHID